MRTNPIRSQRVLKNVLRLMIYCLAFGFVGCSSEPPDDFKKLPLHVIYSNSAEQDYGITVNDLINYGVNPKAEKSWKKVENGTWSLIMSIDDKVTGKTTKINIVLVQQSSPDRAIFHRILVNGQEANSNEKDGLANQFAIGTLETKKGK